MDSFLSSIHTFMKKMPDHRPRDLDQQIRPKCVVLNYPIQFPDVSRLLPKHKLLRLPAETSHVGDIIIPPDEQQRSSREHDKNPEMFFKVLLKLKERRLDFQVSVIGETFTDVPEIFASSQRLLDRHVLNWGFQSGRDQYLQVLCDADVVVSTAAHEFFGVAMLEAVHCGCFPLCPKELVYPEIFPEQYLYSTPEQLCRRLQELCQRPDVARRHIVMVNTSLFSWSSLKPRFKTLLAGEHP